MARHYLRGWFLIDFPASVPVDWVKYLPGVGSSEDATSLRYISILKVCACVCGCALVVVVKLVGVAVLVVMLVGVAVLVLALLLVPELLVSVVLVPLP